MSAQASTLQSGLSSRIRMSHKENMAESTSHRRPTHKYGGSIEGTIYFTSQDSAKNETTLTEIRPSYTEFTNPTSHNILQIPPCSLWNQSLLFALASVTHRSFLVNASLDNCDKSDISH